MCGVLGITIKDFKNEDCGLIRSLFRQSMIRGKHATGISFVKENSINTFKEPIPADRFIEKYDIESLVNEDGNLYCVGHIRYSTSDLRYNQPFANDAWGVVHNGVISQESPDTWYQTYNIQTETANDSELVLHALNNKKNPLTYFSPASMAVCAINKNKRLIAFRNESRPLYYYQDDRMVIFTSTKNIAERSGLNNSIKTEMYRTYIVEDFDISYYDTGTEGNIKDLQ